MLGNNVMLMKESLNSFQKIVFFNYLQLYDQEKEPYYEAKKIFFFHKLITNKT